MLPPPASLDGSRDQVTPDNEVARHSTNRKERFTGKGVLVKEVGDTVRGAEWEMPLKTAKLPLMLE